MENLRDAFVQRESRFALLDKGVNLAGFAKSAALLEVGCAGGEASAYLAECGFFSITAIDIDTAIIAAAGERFPGCSFVCADACDLPFEDGRFDGIYSEAAFAPITEKYAAAREYTRVLKPGGRILLNDFALRELSGAERVEGIPMLMGVQTMAQYKEIFEALGLKCIYGKEEFAELIRIAISLSRRYNVPPSELGKYIISAFGRDEFVNDFFSQTQMSYCQMIYEKV